MGERGNMVIAFLDLLGFSDLMKINIQAAYNNLDRLNRTIKENMLDNISHPVENYNDKLREFAIKNSVTSFKNLISISDSLIIGAEDIDIFIDQISTFLASLFRMTIEDINSKEDVLDKFPIMFRGGITVGNDVNFSPEMYIKDGKIKTGINVCGLSYVKAVKLESTTKGPRLFVDNEFIKNLNDEKKRLIKEVDKTSGISEIIWTYYLFEAGERSDDKLFNLQSCLYNKVLPHVRYIYDYYSTKECKEHYIELIKLLYKGAIMYAGEEKECSLFVKKQFKVYEEVIKDKL